MREIHYSLDIHYVKLDTYRSLACCTPYSPYIVMGQEL